MGMNIETRRKQLVATQGSRRRCYNGCFHSSDWETVDTDWETLELNVAPENVENRLEFWRDLNAYAVSQRGVGARREFRAKES